MIRLTFDSEIGECDLAQAVDGGVDEGDELGTAVLISLFTDRRVGEEELPVVGGQTDVERSRARGGWWGDAYPDGDEEDAIGSRLWLLTERGKLLPDAPLRAQAYAIEALDWMIADGVARAVEAVATRNGEGRLDLVITITRTDGSIRTYEVPDAV